MVALDDDVFKATFAQMKKEYAHAAAVDALLIHR